MLVYTIEILEEGEMESHSWTDVNLPHSALQDQYRY